MQTFTLSEATAARRRFFLHLVDATDGITPETGEAAGQPQVSQNGAAFANTTATLTAVANGLYYVELTAAELNTLGKVIVRYKSANTAEFQDVGMVFNLDLFTTVTQTGDNFARIGAPAGASVSADVAAVKAQTQTINNDTDDIQTRLPAALVGGRIDASVGAVAANAITAASIAADAIGASELAADAVAEIQSGLATSAALATVQADTDDIQTRLPAALVGGRIDASVGAVAANAITAASIATDAIDADALAADAVAEIQSGLATAANLAIVAGYIDTEVAAILAAVDTEVAAIKAVTDLLTLAGIADAILSRPISNVEGSAAFRTLAGAIAKLVNRLQIDGSTLRIKKTDDATDFGTQTMTTDSGAVPVVELNTD